MKKKRNNLILDANKGTIYKDFEVLDLDTGKFLRGVFWANQTTREYKQYKFDKDGLITIQHQSFDYVTKKGNIVLVYKGD